MITIYDKLGLLNLNHFAIYLMLTPEEITLYAEKLKGLNRYTTLTRGIFHFDIVEKGETPYDNLPEEMIVNMRHYNVMVRIVNSIHGIYCYGMEEINLEADMPSIVEKLTKFVREVCYQNINHLDILGNRISRPSVEAQAYYREKKIAISLFEEALKGVVTNKKEGELSLQRTASNPDIKTSLGIVKSAIDSKTEKLDSKIEKERCQIVEPDQRPHIKISVTYVKTGKVLKDGRDKKKLGIELNIDGNIVPVCFGSTDQTFLYIITLMSILEDQEIGRADFLAPEVIFPDLTSPHRYFNKIRLWIENRYRALLFNKKFDDWYLGVKNDLHPLDVAMAAIKQTLWNHLRFEFKNAYYYCIIVNDKGTYRIRIGRNNISIDPIILNRIPEE